MSLALDTPERITLRTQSSPCSARVEPEHVRMVESMMTKEKGVVVLTFLTSLQ